jgi:hypothetical protein
MSDTHAASKVKALEWEDFETESLSKCGTYRVYRLDDCRRETWRLLRASFDTQYVGDFVSTVDLRAEAKGAAQADHQKRTVGNLQPAPAETPRPVGAALPLQWQTLSERAYRADAPLFGSIRVENYKGHCWSVNWSAPGISDTLIEGEWDTPEAAMRAAEDHVSSELSLHAGRMAKIEIEALRIAVVRYGNRSRMATVEPMSVQQAIDRAFEEVGHR